MKLRICDPHHIIPQSRCYYPACVEGLDVRTVGVSFASIRVKQLGVWVMSQLDARLGRGYSSVGSLNQLPTMPAPSEWDGTFNPRQNYRRAPAQSAQHATHAIAALPR